MTTVGPKLLALAIQTREQSDARQSATFNQIYHQTNLADAVIGTVMPMSTSRPEICDHPLIQADDLRFYLSDRLRDDNIDLYSAFFLAHEALRIGRNGYLQPAWNYNLSISGLLRIFMHCLTARAFRADSMATIAEDWLVNDASHLQEHRPHFFTDRLSDGRALITDGAFLESLSEMREQYDSLNDDDGPVHVEVFPWHYAAPERELLTPDSQARFRNTTPVDPEVEDLIVDLRRGQWASQTTAPESRSRAFWQWKIARRDRVILDVLQPSTMAEPSPYTSPSIQESHLELHESRIRAKFRIRYVPSALLFLLGVLLVIWGVVAFCLSYPKASGFGTIDGYVKWCGSSVLMGIVGSLLAASGICVAKARIAVALTTVLLGTAVLCAGSYLLLPYILDGP